MNTAEKADLLARLHVKGSPLILYNCWDAGSAKAIAGAGYRAIGTSSWAIAEAHDYRDAEAIPIGFLEQIVSRIAASCDIPVSVDFEGGYTDDDGQLAKNVERLVDLGVVGINFEDRIVKGEGLYDVARQSERIAIIHAAAERKNVRLFINARTDIFFERPGDSAESVDEAIERCGAYAEAGASGFFVPGLLNVTHIARICEEASLPVNVMLMGEGAPTIRQLEDIGVSRVSYGPLPFISLMEALRQHAVQAMGHRAF